MKKPRQAQAGRGFGFMLFVTATGGNSAAKIATGIATGLVRNGRISWYDADGLASKTRTKSS
jgi:flavoprotein